MVQGEELNTVATIRDLDYQASVPLSYIWPLYSPQSSGVPTVWLDELWSDVLAGQRPEAYRTDVRAWLDSAEFNSAWRNFMALALLHDIPVCTAAPVARREALYGQMDRFGVTESAFMGYWEPGPAWADQPILISAYLRAGSACHSGHCGQRDGNAHRRFRRAPSGTGSRLPDLPPEIRAVASRYATTGAPTVIPPRDFALLEIR